jgi:hypothetical protein
MAKETKKKSADTKKTSKEADNLDRHPIRSFLKAVALLVFIGFSVYGYLRARDHVVKNVTFSQNPPKVILKDRPSWMSDALANKIARVAAPDVAYSAFDHQLLVNTAMLLRTHPDSAPWIKNVRSVRREYEKTPGDMLEIDCDFRAPVALVKWETFYWLIDGDGILLPEQYTQADLRKVTYDGDHVSLRIIEGVGTSPPESGQKWQGADLAAGIEMVRLLYGKPYANEIERINVTNFDGRQDPREAQLVLITRYQTQVRWGRPIHASDFRIEVSPEQKLDYMARLVHDFGRVDAGHSAVELRFDQVQVPSTDTLGTQANTGH